MKRRMSPLIYRSLIVRCAALRTRNILVRLHGQRRRSANHVVQIYILLPDPEPRYFVGGEQRPDLELQ